MTYKQTQTNVITDRCKLNHVMEFGDVTTQVISIINLRDCSKG